MEIKVKIIEYNDSYRDEICTFINECMHKFINRPYKKRADIENIRNYYIDKGGTFLLAIDIDTNKIVGSIVLETRGDYGILKRFYVSEDCQHKGIGQQLFNRLENFVCKETSCTKIYLTCSNVLSSAHSFYTVNGFKQINKPDIELHYANDDDFFMKVY